MDVALFDFDLPDEAIALRPVSPRDAARLLVMQPGEAFQDRHVRDLPGFLRPGDALVVNETRVIPARLYGIRKRETGEGLRVEALLVKREAPDCWIAMMRPAKRLAAGDRIRFGTPNNSCLTGALDATVAGRLDDGTVRLAFDMAGPALDAAVMAAGEMPLPPYIASKRRADDRDLTDYQTIYARHEGSVAAPTAGLHMTQELLATLDAAGIARFGVTLHVGPGTFLPVKASDTQDHVMHAEWGEVDAKTAADLNAVKANGGRVIALGTTALRLLESATSEDGHVQPFAGETAIFITPGYRFRCVDGLMTNFHLPKSTLFMLVSAFCGLSRMRLAYEHAIAAGYRFYSYGDASLLFREDGA
jgi:S-adenosylmethionine:tRNA ribosyltransferase-isomerase